jgi:hypothetical protein
MTSTHDNATAKANQMLALCETVKPQLIYFAVGPAHNLQQQYPPPIANWPGTKLCFLIDPLFEEKLVLFEELGLTPDPEGIARWDDATFVVIRDRFFLNNSYGELLDTLCAYCMHNPTQMIVQDYCGGFLNPSTYPIQKYGPGLKEAVLFDMTYGDDKGSTCFLDFTKVHIFRTPTGGFFHPTLERLTHIRGHVSNHLIRSEMKRRSSDVMGYAHRYYCVQMGLKEERDWCTEAATLDVMRAPCAIYSLPVDPTPAGIRALLWTLYEDFCWAANEEPLQGAEYETTLLNTKSDEFPSLMRTLRDKIPETP